MCDTYTCPIVIYKCVTLGLTISGRGRPEDLFPESENLRYVDVRILGNKFTYAPLLSVT